MTATLGQVNSWTIDPEFSTPSDHELIVFDLENLNESVGSLGSSQGIT